MGCRVSAVVSGVDRAPGETTAVRTPQRTSVSTSTLHQSELVLRKSRNGDAAGAGAVIGYLRVGGAILSTLRLNTRSAVRLGGGGTQ